MDILSIIGLGIVAAVLALVIRQQIPEYALLLSLGTGVLILVVVVINLAPLVDQINNMLEVADINSEHIGILFRALGICFITQLASDTCKDAGEGAIASKVEIAGRAAILIVSLPLFGQVLSIAYALIM